MRKESHVITFTTITKTLLVLNDKTLQLKNLMNFIDSFASKLDS